MPVSLAGVWIEVPGEVDDRLRECGVALVQAAEVLGDREEGEHVRVRDLLVDCLQLPRRQGVVRLVEHVHRWIISSAEAQSPPHAVSLGVTTDAGATG